jgi:uncharacterized protein (DUF885 family)
MQTRREVVAGLAGAGLVSACATNQQHLAPSRELARIADSYVAALFSARPELAYIGFGDIGAPDYSRMQDISPEAIAAHEAIEDDLLADLQRIHLPADAPRAERVLRQALVEKLTANIGLRVAKRELWSLSHLDGGWQVIMPRTAQAQPVATVEHREAALIRWRAFPILIRQDMENHRRGLVSGYAAPKSVVARVVAQIEGQLAGGVERSPYSAVAMRAGGSPPFQAAFRELVEREINPALAAYRDFLKTEYMPKARDGVAVRDLPNGEAIYAAYLRFHTSLPVSARETFDRGMQATDENRAVIERLGRQSYGVEGFEATIRADAEAAGNRFASEEELISYTRAFVDSARDKVAPLFHSLPKHAVIVEPYPEFQRGTGAPSSYQLSAPGEPATYRINSESWKTDTRGLSERTALHEAWPGHHLQVMIAREISGLHAATRLMRFNAFTEGWGRYAEALGEDASVYTSASGPIARRGYPARGMVVDPGLHVFGWTRQQAVDLLAQSGRFPPEAANAQVDRVAVEPAQLTSYDTGGLEIMRLRTVAQARLGGRFDIREFHRRVLENGSVPLVTLQTAIEDWLTAA